MGDLQEATDLIEVVLVLEARLKKELLVQLTDKQKRLEPDHVRWVPDLLIIFVDVELLLVHLFNYLSKVLQHI